MVGTQVFDEETLMLEGVKKGKMINQLQSEMKLDVDFYKRPEEYEESRALNFIKGFWHGDEQVKILYPQYSIEFGKFFIPDEISDALSRFTIRKDQEGNQNG